MALMCTSLSSVTGCRVAVCWVGGSRAWVFGLEFSTEKSGLKVFFPRILALILGTLRYLCRGDYGPD